MNQLYAGKFSKKKSSSLKLQLELITLMADSRPNCAWNLVDRLIANAISDLWQFVKPSEAERAGVTLGPGTNRNCLDNWLSKGWRPVWPAASAIHVPCRKWMQLRGERKNSVGGQDATMSDEVNWPFAGLTGYVPRTCRRGSVLYFRHVHACPNCKQRALLWTVKREYLFPPCVQTHSFNC